MDINLVNLVDRLVSRNKLLQYVVEATARTFLSQLEASAQGCPPDGCTITSITGGGRCGIHIPECHPTACRVIERYAEVVLYDCNGTSGGCVRCVPRITDIHCPCV